MMFKHTLIKTAVMSAALALAPAALMAADDSQNTAGQSQSSQSGQSSAVSGARHGSQSDRSSSRIGHGSFNEQKFVQKAMEGNQFEIQLGQLAQQKAENQEVKQLAQMLIQDHQQANQSLSQAAGGQSGQAGQSGASARAGQSGAQASGTATGSASSGSQQLSPVCQAKLAEFQQLQGAEFDNAYVLDQLADHVKDVLKYRMASQEAQNPQIKQYATQTLPKLQSHLQQLQQLAGWDEASTAGAKIHGDRSSSDHQAGDTSTSNRQDVKGALGGTNGNATDRNAASGGAQQGDRSTGQQNR